MLQKYMSSIFEWVLDRETGRGCLFNLAKRITNLVVLGRYTAFSNNQKMVSIVHKELGHNVEKLKHMKLEVMQPKITNKSELPARE